MGDQWTVKSEYQSRPHARGDAWVFTIKRGEDFWGILVDEQTRYKTRFEPGSETHEELDEFIVCIEGRYWVKVGNWSRTLAPGEVAVIPNSTPHDSGVATNLVGMHFLVLLFPKKLGVLDGVTPGGVALPLGGLSWLKGAFKFLRTSPNEVGFLPLTVLPEFLRLITAGQKLAPDASHPDPVVAEIVKLLEQADMPPLAAIAQHVGLTPSHLQRRFLAAVGSSPLQYARAWQLDRIAEELIHGSTLPLVEIATEHGFNDQKHFRQLFKRRFG
ncbi:MAG: AraC family transcriptional regulator, partial [Pseudomonadota bacterium]